MKMSFLFCFFIYCNALAQSTPNVYPRDADKKVVIDDVKLRITYRVRISVDTLGNEHYFDNQILEIGEKYNRYYSFFAEDIDSVKWRVHNDHKRVKSSQGGAYQPRENLARDEYGTYEDIFTNYPKQGATTVYNGYFHKFYVYEEPISTFEWEFNGGKEIIIGYECIEATTSFRGRDYRVWFTVDVPYNYGPWKFSGLPGLILKAEDTKGLFKWEAIGVEQPKSAKMYRYDIDARKCKREDILRLNDQRWKDYVGLGIANGMKGFLLINEETNEVTPAKHGDRLLDPIPQLELK